MKRRCGVLKKFDSRTGANYTYMSHPFSHSDLLRSQGCYISMIQTGNPPHNALAERMNNTLKNSWYISSVEQTSEEATLVVARAVAYQ